MGTVSDTPSEIQRRERRADGLCCHALPVPSRARLRKRSGQRRAVPGTTTTPSGEQQFIEPDKLLAQTRAAILRSPEVTAPSVALPGSAAYRKLSFAGGSVYSPPFAA